MKKSTKTVTIASSKWIVLIDGAFKQALVKIIYVRSYKNSRYESEKSVIAKKFLPLM